MIQNIKVDVIYYKCPTDFEMEFNLCGCCRMRMLTDKAGDRSDLIRSLSRAVSRSRVIICSGPLFEAEGLIKSVAAAIGKSLERVNSAAYGIRTSSDIEVIKGSMPLVTADGMFGGCIIESGPQSIVILTESRSIRKALMGSLIHPYIEELSRAVSARPQTEEVPQAAAEKPDIISEPVIEQPEPVVAEQAETDAQETAAEPPTADEIIEAEAAETDEAAEEAEISAEETAAEAEKNTEADDCKEQETPEQTLEEISKETSEEAEAPSEEEKTEDTAAETDADERSENTAEVREAEPSKEQYEPELYLEPENVKFSRKNYYENSYGDIGEESGYITGDGEDYRPSRRPMKTALTVILIILLIAVIALLYLLVFEPLRAGISPSEYLSELFESASAVSRAGSGI